MDGNGLRSIKTLPRFHCDYCSHTSTEKAMIAHEKICWLNPNRYCDSCKNEGVYAGENGLPDEPCYYCDKRTKPDEVDRSNYGPV